MSKHQSDVGRAKVTLRSYPDVEEHWRTILTSIFEHQSAPDFNATAIEDYCIIALYKDREGNGVVVGKLSARYRLVVMNSSDIHFDPCLPL